MTFKRLLTLSTFLFTLLVPFSVYAMQGDGTAEYPFLITNQAELETVDSFPDCHFRLENDIVLDGSWLPLCSDSEDAPFTGVFDGGYYTVSNLTIGSGRESLGLFGYNSGTIKNLRVVTSEYGIDSSLSEYAGGVAGVNLSGGLIDSCSFDGTINGGSSGGIVSRNCGTISKCFSSGGIYVSSNKTCFGVGGSNGGRITDCYSRVEFGGGGEYGIGSDSSNCYYAGTSSINYPIGVGCVNSFYDKTISGMTSTYYGTPKTTIAMKMKETYTDAGWDFENTWGIDPEINDGYPYLLWEYPEVCSAEAEIIFATATEDSLKFISEATITGVPEIDTFGTAFIPLWLFEIGSSDTVIVEYDNSLYDIGDGNTFGATITAIPSSCKTMNIVGKSYIKSTSGNYTWSSARSASVVDTTLDLVE